eukprot:CAMPEP_0183410616 /NCGR_PEP_ID=MMETSP0370-20130417/19703_1 /TAXON_ID=268820 /ORGANISM="Peridinium aciculiferum, Strain PAER-2" /LENGTH=92 /DNA_ID=CAMNT_0025593473 /DNA_START=51 /DNA_END=329 /DNA_ORIENTATION=-
MACCTGSSNSLEQQECCDSTSAFGWKLRGHRGSFVEFRGGLLWPPSMSDAGGVGRRGGRDVSVERPWHAALEAVTPWSSKSVATAPRRLAGN